MLNSNFGLIKALDRKGERRVLYKKGLHSHTFGRQEMRRIVAF